MQFEIGEFYTLDEIKAHFPSKIHSYSNSFWTNGLGKGAVIAPAAFSKKPHESEFVSATNYSYRCTTLESEAILKDWTGFHPKLKGVRLDMVVNDPKSTDKVIFLGLVMFAGLQTTDDGGVVINFQLEEKLSWSNWLSMGGFEGWTVFRKDNSRVNVVSVADVDQFLDTIQDSDELLAGIRFEEDRFAAGLQSSKGYLTYHTGNPKSKYVLFSDLPIAEGDENESFCFFPDDDPCEISMRIVCTRELVLSSLKEILLAQKPTMMSPDPFAP